MSTITIEGLSAKQRFFADILWQLNGRDQVDAFIDSLPQRERNEANVVLAMMVAAVFDQVTDTTDAERILKGI